MKEVLVPVPESDLHAGVGTKVVVTLGPSCQSVDVLVELLAAGMTCARVDLTWGPATFHQVSLENLAKAMHVTGRLCCVWLDTTGREITVRRPAETTEDGWLHHGTPIEIKKGQSVTLTPKDVPASETMLPITYPGFADALDIGQTVVVGRYLSTGAEGGTLLLEVTEKQDLDIVTIAQTDASLDGLLTVMAAHPNEANDAAFDMAIPIMTQHDANCIKKFGKEYEIDYISLSYCSSVEDLTECRAFLDALGMFQTKIIAKVERKPAVRNFDAICLAADGVLISRGNLGLDYDAELMSLLQKRLVGRCNLLGKPVIVTRFVDTMVNTPRPTRAEATDVANAVLDVVRLCRAAELHFDYRSHHELMVNESFDEGLSLSHPSASEADIPGSYAGLPSSASLLGMSEPVPSSLTLATGVSQAPTGAGPMWADGGSPPHPASGLGGSPTAHTVSAFGSVPSRIVQRGPRPGRDAAYLQKLESVASNATRTAEKIAAGLIVVLTASGRTISLVAKFRPPMPVMAVVVPTLKSDRLRWRLEGKYLARQCLTMRGVFPMLAAPMSSGSDDLLSEAIGLAAENGLCKPLDYVVVITTERGALVVKIVRVDEAGEGLLHGGEGRGPLAPEQAGSFTSSLMSPGLSNTLSGSLAAGQRTSPFGSEGGSPFARGVPSPFGAAPAASAALTQGAHHPTSPGGRGRRRAHQAPSFLGAMTDADAISAFARAQQTAAHGSVEPRLRTLSEL
ncbi:Pyruvate kinase [Auxenochlorella protothecoides]|uniref:Pyruvate kinase n=1 Tax=Auxenochlorella protothecoides TaxID=3075 RepID=A0A087SSM4_AUXPR|nr:Pyruvate kinase [Auxenochlorella protothecoides]KFM28728.1 Pyruvate kinase [Auxenochlorella protothecoides]